MTKRAFDILFSLFGIVALSPVMLACGLAVLVSSRGPIFFRQERMGMNFRPFGILKFRSMVVDAPKMGEQVTVSGDSRVTSVGRLIRKAKLDELPQLFNVLLGDMSFVGPRPEVPEYVNQFRSEYESLLRVRPGITGIASITYRNEEAILAASSDPKHAYVTEVLPEKIRLGQLYVDRHSLTLDVRLIIMTLFKIFGRELRLPDFSANEPIQRKEMS